MPHADQPNRRGDFFATMEAIVPTKLTTVERSLFEQFEKLRQRVRRAA